MPSPPRPDPSPVSLQRELQALNCRARTRASERRPGPTLLRHTARPSVHVQAPACAAGQNSQDVSGYFHIATLPAAHALLLETFCSRLMHRRHGDTEASDVMLFACGCRPCAGRQVSSWRSLRLSKRPLRSALPVKRANDNVVTTYIVLAPSHDDIRRHATDYYRRRRSRGERDTTAFLLRRC